MADRLVTIATFGSPTEAYTAKNALEAEGIRAALDNEQSSALFGSVIPSIGFRLVVREEDEQRAVQVLDETFGPTPGGEEELAARAESEPAEDPVEAGQKTPPAPDQTADSAARDGDARSALVAACLGLLVPCVGPLALLFVVVMIARALSGPGELSRHGRRQVYAAGAIVALPLLAVALYLLLVVRGEP
ncbi:MAG: DUF2007 domain-containing protein [Gemmataceae bacterium]|nr:DUF2007 domain-containing protein [Gemmataceae bacterium]